jgi:hypothetical protein
MLIAASEGIRNLFNYSLLNFKSGSGSYGIITNTPNSITFDCVSEGIASVYFYAANQLNLKPNTTYTSKCKVICVDNGSTNTGAAGSMILSLLVQDTMSWGTKKFYLVNGYKASITGKEGTYEVYTTFTTPDDLTDYKYIVTRVSSLTSVTFENLKLVEGEYTKDDFPI